MKPAIKHKLTNWTDGMKISRKHFIDSENALLDITRDSQALQLTNYNFGLLPPLPGERTSLEFSLHEVHANRFKISVSLCRAVTPGGFRIEITPQNNREVQLTASIDIDPDSIENKSNQEPQHIILSVNPFERKPSGEPDVDENPPRHPYTLPEYRLHILPSQQVNSGDFSAHHLTIGKLKWKANRLEIDETFIPPCATIHGFHTLLQQYKNLGTNLSHMQRYSTAVIKNIVTKGQNAPLPGSVKQVCESILRYTSSLFFEYRMIIHQQAPIFMINRFVQLANEIRVSLDCLPEKEKEDMLLYFKEWMELSPSKFNELLNEVIELEYNHNDLNQSLDKVNHFSFIIADLLKKLSELELIGKKKEQEIFVREIETTAEKPKKKGFSILD